MSFTMEKLAFGIVAISMLLIGGSIFAGDISTNYNTTIEDKSFLNKSMELEEYTEEITKSLNNTRTDGFGSVANFFMSAIVNSVMLMVGMAQVLWSLLIGKGSLISMLGIPSWTSPFIALAVSIIVIFIIINALKGGQKV